jgi:hypothetical protein
MPYRRAGVAKKGAGRVVLDPYHLATDLEIPVGLLGVVTETATCGSAVMFLYL